jgi:cysteine-rich repeat protein
MTGPWFTRIFVIFFPDVLECPLDIVQTGMMFTVTGDCPLVGNVNIAGTIDPLTGDFEGSGTAAGACPTITLTDGHASLDNTTFHVSFQCSGGPLPALGGIDGYRCGNGVFEPGIGEVCEDGNHLNGDCGSNTCQYEPAGQFCSPNDANVCTDDVCDGAGTCIHVNNTGPCDDFNQCTTGDHCVDGACVTTVVPDGDPCTDFNDCTADSCQGGTCVSTTLPEGTACNDGFDCYAGETCLAGQCQLGSPVTCEPCLRCYEGFGCRVEEFGYTCETADADAIRLDNADPDSANWRFQPYVAAALADIGDPLSGTSYEFCVIDPVNFDSASFPALIFGAALPAGNSWKQTHSGYYFRSPDKKMRVRIKDGSNGGQAKILLRARGPAYDVTYLPPVDYIEVFFRTAEGVTPQHCFHSYFYPPLISTPTKYRAQYPVP